MDITDRVVNRTVHNFATYAHHEYYQLSMSIFFCFFLTSEGESCATDSIAKDEWVASDNFAQWWRSSSVAMVERLQ